MTRGIAGTKAPHGTVTRYTKHDCRCEECLQAMRDYRSRKLGRTTVPLAEYIASVTRHGIKRYKTKGCRCDVCRAASAAQKRRNRDRNRVTCSSCGGPRLADRDTRAATGLCQSCYRTRKAAA